ncbi:long-chain fatty acid--CoA ligase [Streptomyces sp. NBC_00656]|uniref:acyl-CoA synthetase n=1 Tax=Streptomyces sp. NBC_00656 TaxID=2903668 RepID=UPI0032460E24
MYLTQSLHRAVQQFPDEIASVCGDRTRTHREVGDRVARLAGALRALGVAKGDRVALLAHNSDVYHEFLYGVWWVGGAVNLVNTRWSNPEIAYSLEDSDTRILFVDDAFAPEAARLRALWSGLTTVVHCGDGPTPPDMLSYGDLIGGHEPVEDLRVGGDALAGLFYTGGTTGFPKGVMLSHAGIVTSGLGLISTGQGVRRGGRYLHCAPLFHCAALGTWNNQNLVGGSHVFLPSFDATAVLEAVQKHRVSALLLVPAMIQVLVSHPRLADYDLSSLVRIGYGASPISETLLRRAMEAFKGVAVQQSYGMTELSPGATILTPEDHLDPVLRRSAGRAISCVEIRILDPAGNEVPRGTVGEIAARGGNVMLGYWKKPEETAEALRGGWMHTGDAGYMDKAGYVYIVDRLKDMIVTGGENVYSAEVENALAQHPAVASCAVIGVPDAQWGERVHAVIELRPGARTTTEEVREHCKTLISGYKSPRSCEFVEAMPLSPAGKILKRDLRKPHWEKNGRSVS